MVHSKSQKTRITDLIGQYETQLVRYASSFLGDVDRARDVVQDTFLKLCREDPDKVNGRLPQWLFTVCRNRALDIRKKEARMKELPDGQATACVDQTKHHIDSVEQKDESEKIGKLLNGLSDNQKEVVRLKFQNGLSYREISEITKLTVTNVGYLLHTALKQIREQVA